MSGLMARSTTGGVWRAVRTPARSEYGVRAPLAGHWNRPGVVCVAADVTETTRYLPAREQQKTERKKNVLSFVRNGRQCALECRSS